MCLFIIKKEACFSLLFAATTSGLPNKIKTNIKAIDLMALFADSFIARPPVLIYRYPLVEIKSKVYKIRIFQLSKLNQ